MYYIIVFLKEDVKKIQSTRNIKEALEIHKLTTMEYGHLYNVKLFNNPNVMLN